MPVGKQKFYTLDDKFYFIDLKKYVTRLFKKSASDFQYKWKQFFMTWLPDELWLEEFKVRPLLRLNYRLDLYCPWRRFAVECHGDQHVSVSPHFHAGSQDKFLDALIKDREKELWCEKNNIELITTYTSTPMDKDFFKQKYPKIRW